MNNTTMKVKLPILLVSAVCLFATHLQARVWTSADGTSKTEAEFISARDGKVTFQKPGGQPITFAIDKLSEEDQAWVKEKLAAGPAPGATGSTARTGAEKANDYTKRITGKWERMEDAELEYRLFGARKLKGSKLYQDKKLHEWMFEQAKGKEAEK
jgi:hypothetical protein